MNSTATILVSLFLISSLLNQTSTGKVTVTQSCTDYCAKKNMQGGCHISYMEDPLCGGRSSVCRCYDPTTVTDDDETCATYCHKSGMRAACTPAYFEDPKCGGRSARCSCY